jgi:protocatechuate 3,4-dioxygenase beta subunit
MMNLINHKAFERTDENRRRMLRLMAMSAIFARTPGAFADELLRTPAQTEGPFYPDKLPLDTDNDLLIINNTITAAVGEITWVSGKILDATGKPLRNALVEIWQCDANGAYLHSGTGNKDKADKHFQGYGRFVTGSSGEYGFRTIKPVPYPGRTPHIHYKISQGGKHLLTTQCYIKGHTGNARDGVLRGIRDPKQLESLMVDFKPLEGSKIGELAGKFDFVLGLTPNEA